MRVFTWQRSTREQGHPVVSYPQSFRIQIQSIRTPFEYPWALVLPLSLFTVYTFKPVYDAYCSILPCHVSEVRGEVMDIIRHLTMLHPVATFLYGADWLLQRVTQTPAPDVKSMVQSYFWIKLSSVITFQPSSARERDLVTSASDPRRLDGLSFQLWWCLFLVCLFVCVRISLLLLFFFSQCTRNREDDTRMGWTYSLLGCSDVKIL